MRWRMAWPTLGGCGMGAVKLGELVMRRYRVQRELAAGGASVVYLAHDERLARPVCIKVFAFSDGVTADRGAVYDHFVQEAFALSRLTHPSTLRIYDFGHVEDAARNAPAVFNDLDGALEMAMREAGTPVQVYEYVNGGTLSQLVREHGALTWSEVWPIVESLCGALAEAHSLGIIHRDIKPQNILFTQNALTLQVKLADFGIAKWDTSDAVVAMQAQRRARTLGPRAMYSPTWAPPEQLEGRATSAATDVYSLAAVALFLLTGEALFAGDTSDASLDLAAALLRRKSARTLIGDALLRARDIGPLPDTLWPVFCKALAYAPAERYQSVVDFSLGLRIANGAPLEPLGGVFARASSPVLRAKGTAVSDEQTLIVRAEQSQQAAQQAAAAARPVPFVAQQRWLNRQLSIVYAPNGNADMLGPVGATVSLSILRATNSYCITATTGLVEVAGLPPARVMQFYANAEFAVVDAAGTVGCRAKLLISEETDKHYRFVVDGLPCLFEKSDCVDPVCIDFGAGAAMYVVYCLGRAVGKAARA